MLKAIKEVSMAESKGGTYDKEFAYITRRPRFDPWVR